MNENVLDNKIIQLYQTRARQITSEGKLPQFTEIAERLRREEKIGLHSSLEDAIKKWHNNVFNLNYLQHHLTDPRIDEIIMHNNVDCQLIVANNKRGVSILGLSAEEYAESLSSLAHLNKIDWNYRTGFASFFVEMEGILLRATLCHASLGVMEMPKLFLRKIKAKALGLAAFSSHQRAVDVITNAIEKRDNILIAGATGSGKTALMHSMMELLPSGSHVIVMEETHELKRSGPYNTPLLSGESENKTLEAYCAHALRMTPDRIILGEMRSREVVPFVLSMSNGHKGMMSTIHANSAAEALSRVSLLFSIYQDSTALDYSLVMKLMCQSIDTVVYLQDREIMEVIKVLGNDGPRPFYEYIYRLQNGDDNSQSLN